jgi:hypothetical protein
MHEKLLMCDALAHGTIHHCHQQSVGGSPHVTLRYVRRLCSDREVNLNNVDTYIRNARIICQYIDTPMHDMLG